MHANLVERVVTDERAVPYQADDPFTDAYFAFVEYFRRVDRVDPHHLIIGAHFTYGWMPTMLRMRSGDYAVAAKTLDKAKCGGRVSDSEMAALAAIINNSLVGESKLLHFANPHQYPIWDSRVYRYLHGGNDYQPHLHKVSAYRAFLATCCTVANDLAFEPAHASLNLKFGKAITPLRAVEIVMYTAGARRPLGAIQAEVDTTRGT